MANNKALTLFIVVIISLCLVASSTGSKLSYTAGSVQVNLDRNAAIPDTVNINYRLLDLFYDADNAGPILVGVCGQEKLEADCMPKMQDMLEDLAPRMFAAILFIEHRYFGASTKPELYSAANLVHLHVDEVLEDIRQVINSPLLAKLGQKRMERTVLVGQDYAGALAIWMNLQSVKDANKEKPAFTWAASPSPLALWPDTAISNQFDAQLTQILVEQFGCSKEAFSQLFAWIVTELDSKDDTRIGVVKNALLYEGKETNAKEVQENVLDVLRLFVARRNVPIFDRASKQFSWPVELFCADLKKATTDEDRAKAMGQFVKQLAQQPSRSKFNYEQLINEGLTENELTAKNFQRCTQLPADNCAAGSPKDAFFQQCQGADHIKTKCKGDWLSAVNGYDQSKPGMEYQPDFVKDTFGYDFSALRNVLITTGKLDQFTLPSLPESNLDRKFFVYSIGLSGRGQELLQPSSCNSEAMKQARTQIADILICSLSSAKLSPEICVAEQKWPYPLNADTREQDRERHSGGADGSGSCLPLYWHYPWTSNYRDAQPGPAPGPAPVPPPSPSGGNGTGNGTENGAIGSIGGGGSGMMSLLLPLLSSALITIFTASVTITGGCFSADGFFLTR